jgi:hypothetical protein
MKNRHRVSQAVSKLICSRASAQGLRAESGPQRHSRQEKLSEPRRVKAKRRSTPRRKAVWPTSQRHAAARQLRPGTCPLSKCEARGGPEISLISFELSMHNLEEPPV